MKFTGQCLKCGREGGRWIRSCECDIDIRRMGHKCKECGHPDTNIMCVHYDFPSNIAIHDKNGVNVF